MSPANALTKNLTTSQWLLQQLSVPLVLAIVVAYTLLVMVITWMLMKLSGFINRSTRPSKTTIETAPTQWIMHIKQSYRKQDLVALQSSLLSAFRQHLNNSASDGSARVGDPTVDCGAAQTSDELRQHMQFLAQQLQQHQLPERQAIDAFIALLKGRPVAQTNPLPSLYPASNA